MTRRVFISDLHLEDVESPTFHRFKELMEFESSQVDEIYILGDLVEMWVGDDDDADIAMALADVIRSASCPVFLMHGNRDFLFGERFSEATGAVVLPDPYLTSDGLLLSHGDSLCTDDQEYQQMRTLFRSEAWQQDLLSKSLDERKALGQMLRSQSKAANANKATNIMDVNENALEALFAEHDALTFIHGHTHRPGIHPRDSAVRMVLGAWERCGWLIRQDGSRFELQSFALNKPYR